MARRVPIDLPGTEVANRTTADYHLQVQRLLAEQRQRLESALQQMEDDPGPIEAAARALINALQSGRKILCAGNGGSAAEAQHFAAELVGRFKCDRRPYAALALSVDSSILTAVANDYGFEWIFARQVLALGKPGDLLVAFSTSGESANLLRAATAARQCGMSVIAVTGCSGSTLERVADIAIGCATPDTAAIQELHMVVTHVLCGIVESRLAGDERS